MDHVTAKELFSDFIEEELSPDREEELRTHLEGCDACRQELDALRSTLRSLSCLPLKPPPKEFAQKVQQRIRKRSRGKFFSAENLLTRIPFEWISFIVILLMLVMYYMLMQVQVTAPDAPTDRKGARPARVDSQAPAATPTTRPAPERPTEPTR